MKHNERNIMFENLPRQLKIAFLMCSLMGIAISVVDMIYSMLFGFSINPITGFGLAALSIGSSCLAILVVAFWRLGFQRFAQGMAVVFGAIFAFNVVSNMGVATSNRLVDVQKANLQKAAHEEKASSKQEAKARLVAFERQHAALLERNAWAATVTAKGLRDQLAILERNRASEAALGGCGPKCRGIETDIVKVQGQIAVAEQRENLDKQIAATKRVLEEARSTLASTDAGISNTANQASLYSRWTVGWFDDGESVGAIRNSNEVMGMVMALVIALGSAGLNLAGAWPHLMNLRPQNTWTPPSGFRSVNIDPPAAAVHLPVVSGTSSGSVPAVAAAAPAAQTVQIGVLDDRSTREIVARLKSNIHAAIKGQPVAA